MIISIIVATADNNVIGKGNKMPWHMPEDLKRFKTLTVNKPVIMGRHTFLSIGKPLINRTNIIVSSQPSFYIQGCITASSIEDALNKVSHCEDVFIIGGSRIYNQAMDIAHRIYLTRICAKIDGDTFFPVIDNTKFKMVEKIDFPSNEKNPYPYSFLTYFNI